MAARHSTTCPGCGNSRAVRLSDWNKRKSDYCGPCSRRVLAGLTPSSEPSGKGTALHNVWRGMRQRCGHISGGHARDIAAYAERGIEVCDEWRLSFSAFQKWAEANGYRDGLILDRKNNDAGYEPGNCRFVGVTESNRNKRSTLDMESVLRIREAKLAGAKQCDLAKEYGVTDGTISYLLSGKTWR
jgi:hypothetical protein